MAEKKKNYTEYERELRDFEKKPLAKDRETLIFPPESDIKGSDKQDASVLPAAPKLSMRKEAQEDEEDLTWEEQLKKYRDEAYEYFSRLKIVPDAEDILNDVIGAVADKSGVDVDPNTAQSIAEILGLDVEANKNKVEKFAVNDKILTSTKKVAKVVKVSEDLIFWVSIDGEKDFGSDFVEDIEPFGGPGFGRGRDFGQGLRRRERGEPIDEGIVKEIPLEEEVELEEVTLVGKNKSMRKKAGTWSLPFTGGTAEELSEIVNRIKEWTGSLSEEDIQGVEEELYSVYGDDKLFDDLDDLVGDSPNSVVQVIKTHVKQLLEYYEKSPENFKGVLEPEAKEILEGI